MKIPKQASAVDRSQDKSHLVPSAEGATPSAWPGMSSWLKKILEMAGGG
jgi:hypothetical protein